MNSSQMEMLVPLLAIALPIIIVAIVAYSRTVNNRQRNETIARFVEKGLPIPQELFSAQSAPKSRLFGAMTLIGVGIGLTVFFIAKGSDNWGIGAIPLAIGLAQLLAWKLEQPKSETSKSNSQE